MDASGKSRRSGLLTGPKHPTSNVEYPIGKNESRSMSKYVKGVFFGVPDTDGFLGDRDKFMRVEGSVSGEDGRWRIEDGGERGRYARGSLTI